MPFQGEYSVVVLPKAMPLGYVLDGLSARMDCVM